MFCDDGCGGIGEVALMWMEGCFDLLLNAEYFDPQKEDQTLSDISPSAPKDVLVILFAQWTFPCVYRERCSIFLLGDMKLTLKPPHVWATQRTAHRKEATLNLAKSRYRTKHFRRNKTL